MKAEKWEGAELAAKQATVAKEDLAAIKRGVVADHWQTLRGLLQQLQKEHSLAEIDLLDVGCGVGYGSAVFNHLLPGFIHRYWGMDTNDHAIEVALKNKWGHGFIIRDICDIALPPSNDIVMSNGTLNHIHEWRDALRNMAATARRWVLLHRLWVYMDDTPTSGMVSQAYGRNVWHMRINEDQMVGVLAAHGFTLKQKLSSNGLGDPQAGWTYLFERA